MRYSEHLKVYLLALCILALLYLILYSKSDITIGESIGILRRSTHCPDPLTLINELVNETQMESCSQDDPALIVYFRIRHLKQPATSGYAFKPQPPSDIMKVLWPTLQKEVGNKSRPFFVEAGANDGLDSSNTVWLEETHGWTGLLVECHPEVLPKLHRTHRKAYISDACLARTKHFSRDVLTSVDGWNPSSSLGGGNIWPPFAKNFTKFEIYTIPLYTMLAALRIRVVDFISLDIQSLKLQVLRTFPFDLILVKVWVVEVILLSPEEKAELVQLMISNGYVVSNMLSGGKWDLVFIYGNQDSSYV